MMNTEEIYEAIFAAIKQLKEEEVLAIQPVVIERVTDVYPDMPKVVVDVAVRKLITANKLKKDDVGGLSIVDDVGLK